MMKLTIFGATGGAGQQLIEQALAAGHHIVAFVRDSSKLVTQHENLTIVQGELVDLAAIERAVEGADAVLSALGPRPDSKGNPRADLAEFIPNQVEDTQYLKQAPAISNQ